MKAAEIIDAAQITLIDKDNTYWQADELLAYINEGQRQIAQLKTDASTATIAHPLVSGPRQTLPDDGLLLIDVVRNLGFTELSASPAITAVDKRVLDRMMPDWTSASDRIVQHYMYDERDRAVFYVYPAQPLVTGRVELCYARRPAVISAASDELTLTGEYFATLLDYVLYRAHSKSTQAAVPQRAAAHYQQFIQQLGGYAQAAMATTAGKPNRNDGALR